MSGHSKWATIKRSKAANDSKRGKVFTKIGREIVVAVRSGGSDPDSNFGLRVILDKARQANMPKDNIERAIKRGAGDLKGEAELEESMYEGYGSQGTAIMVMAVTDNRNRTVSEIRHVFARYSGNLGSEGCVAWMFDRKGYVSIDPGDEDPEEIALVAIDAGAEDVEIGEEIVEVYTMVEDLQRVKEGLSEGGYDVTGAQISWLPKTQQSLGEKETLQTMKLLEALEDLDDVQEVFSNLDIPDEMIAKFDSEAA